MTEKQFKKLMIVLVVVIIVVFIGIMWGMDVYFDMTYYKEGDYSDHKCSFCDNEAMCKVRYTATIYYFCSEHASYGKERVDEQSKSTGSSSSRTAKCKSCGRKYEAGDSAGNFMNIAKTGMCNNCYRNFEDFSWALGK